MHTDIQTNNIRVSGILTCPLNSGYIEFEYAPGDLVKDLLKKVGDIWGGPNVMNTDYWHKNSWTLFCKCEDGTYSILIETDPIPVSPPVASQDLDSDHVDWARKPLRDILAREMRIDDPARCDEILADEIRDDKAWGKTWGKRRLKKSPTRWAS